MMVTVICVGGVLGFFVGVLSIVVFGASVLSGIGIYFGVTLAITVLGIVMMLRPRLPRVDPVNRSLSDTTARF